jgi:hypothetical protein
MHFFLIGQNVRRKALLLQAAIPLVVDTLFDHSCVIRQQNQWVRGGRYCQWGLQRSFSSVCYWRSKGEKVIAIIDNHGYVLAPVPVAPVNETDMVLLPESLHALKQVAKEVRLDLRGAYLNLDGGFDSAHNRKSIFNAGLIPNIPENPRNRKHPKRGRKRLFNAAIHVLRMRVERTFAWEDKFKRLLIRFERIQRRHYGMKLLAYTLINLRKFCGT